MPTLASEAQSLLTHYDYPGNIRELENIIERAVVLSENEVIRAGDLPEKMRFKRPLLPSGGEIKPADSMSLDDVERQHIIRIMEKTNHNQTEAAKILGISRSTLWRKLKTHQLVQDEAS